MPDGVISENAAETKSRKLKEKERETWEHSRTMDRNRT